MTRYILIGIFAFLLCENLLAQYNLASYSFDNTADDSSINANHGTINGAIITTDRFGNDSSAYQFDGTSYIDMGSDPSLNLRDGFSISAWFKRTGSTVTQTIVSRGNMSNGDYWLGLKQDADDFVIEVRLDGEVFTGVIPVNNDWNHVVLTAQTGVDGVRIFLNGEAYGAYTASQDLVGTSSSDFRVGNTAISSSVNFDGTIDDIQVFSKVLDLNTVSLLHGVEPLLSDIGASSFGNALDFDGINDFIVMDPDTLSEVYNGFTIETWAKWNGDPLFPEKNNVIFEILMGDINGGNASGTVRFRTVAFESESAWLNPNSFKIGNGNPVDNEWHHYAVTLDVDLGIGKFYVDGIVTGSIDRSICFATDDCINAADISLPDTDPSSELYGLVAKTPFDESHFSADLFTIGKSQFFDSFYGQLDELKIWNYPKSQIEINSGKNRPATGMENGLVYYFNFDHGISSSDNSGLNILEDIVSNKSGELSGFALNGFASNWIESGFNNNAHVPKLTSVYPTSSIAGLTTKIYSSNIINDHKYNKVFFGEEEATVVSVRSGIVEAIVPEGIIGSQPIRVISSFGSSNAIPFTVISNESNLPFSWENQTLYSQMTPHMIEYGDFDGDRDTDIVAAGPNELLIFVNDGLGNFSPGSIIAEGADYNELTIIDIDSDGRADILCSENVINLVVFNNNGSGSSWTKTNILAHTDHFAIEPIDSDRDGDMDLAVYGRLPELSNEYGIKLISNDGMGNFSFNKVIASGKQYFRSKGLVTNDFNNDGFFDISAVTPTEDPSDNAVNLLLADQNENFSDTRIGDAAEYADILTSADINGDGNPDLVNIGYQCCYNWYVNDGNAGFSYAVSDNYTLSQAYMLESGDLNGDGFTDILVGFFFGGHHKDPNAAWLKNNFETSESFELSPISNEIFDVVDLKAVDLDNDGDLDVVAASTYDNRVTTIFHKFAVNDFESFSLVEQIDGDSAIINKEDHTINLVIYNDAPAYRLIPEFEVSKKASVSIDGLEQVSGMNSNDYRNPVVYAVKAENGDVQEWTVYVNTLPEAPLARDASVITSNSFTANWDADFNNSDYYIVEISDNISFENSITLDTISNASSAAIGELSEGRSYWYRVQAGNQWGVSEHSNIIFVEQPILIKDLFYEELIQRNGSNESAITFNVTGGRNSFEAKIRHKSILGENWQESEVVVSSITGLFEYTFTTDLLDEVGLEFELEVTDSYKTITTNIHSIHWSNIEENLPISSFGGAAGDWQIFSIPYVLEDDFIETIFSELGAMEYKKDWRLVRYEGGKYLDYTEGINRIELGKGYWFNSLEQVDIKVSGEVNSAKTFDMRLRQGWNQIGNPYNVPISWNNTRVNNGLDGSIGGVQLYNRTTLLFEEGDVIQPFGGGFVWADDATTLEVSLVDDYNGGRIESNTIQSGDIDDPAWILQLLLESNGTMQNIAGVGMHPEAQLSKDGYDKMSLPRLNNYTDMTTNHDDYFYHHFSTDVIPTHNKGTWLFTLSSNVLNGSSRLNWDNSEMVTSSSVLWLIDESNGQVINMNVVDNYSFNFSSDSQFSIHLTSGPLDFPTPVLLNLGDPFPNPTDGLTKITVSLPELEHNHSIELSLLDLNGRLVKSIVNGVYAPGVYVFNTSEEVIKSLKDGVYFYKMSFQNSDNRPVYKKLVVKN